jgi:hypothetical protein
MTRITSRAMRSAATATLGALCATAAAGHALVATAEPEGFVEASVGGTLVQLRAPAGQQLTAGRIEQLLTLHDVAGGKAQVLAVYESPETMRFYTRQTRGIPERGLLSTMVVSEAGLELQYVDTRALRNVLADELGERRAFQAYLAEQRLGAGGQRVAIPEPRLLALEDFMVIEGRERLLPESNRRISYCVEAFLGLRNRALLSSTCLIKHDIGREDMYRLENGVVAWAKALLAHNPSSRDPAPQARPQTKRPDLVRDDAGTADRRAALSHLRAALSHRHQDVMIASALLWDQLPDGLKAQLDRSHSRFRRRLEETCNQGEQGQARHQCALLAYEMRLRALEQCTARSIDPILQAETVDFVPGQLPET